MSIAHSNSGGSPCSSTIAARVHGGWRRSKLPAAPHEGEEQAMADCQPAAKTMPVG